MPSGTESLRIRKLGEFLWKGCTKFKKKGKDRKGFSSVLMGGLCRKLMDWSEDDGCFVYVEGQDFVVCTFVVLFFSQNVNTGDSFCFDPCVCPQMDQQLIKFLSLLPEGC